MKLISVFSNKSFDEYKYAQCNKQVIRPCFQDQGAMILKCKSTLVKLVWSTH